MTISIAMSTSICISNLYSSQHYYGNSTKRDKKGGTYSTQRKTGKVGIQMFGWKSSWKMVFGKPRGRWAVWKKKLTC